MAIIQKSTVLIPKELHQKIKVHCAKYNIKMLDYVAWVLSDQLNRQDKLYQQTKLS